MPAHKSARSKSGHSKLLIRGRRSTFVASHTTQNLQPIQTIIQLHQKQARKQPKAAPLKLQRADTDPGKTPYRVQILPAFMGYPRGELHSG